MTKNIGYDGKEVRPGVYRHFRGDLVEVFGVATHSETEEDLVIYTHKGRLWARPIKMWYQIVPSPEDFHNVERFTWVREGHLGDGSVATEKRVV